MSSLLLHPTFVVALTLVLAIAGLAWAAGWLNTSGACAAAAIGFLVYWLGEGLAALPLLAFFVSCSLLTYIGRRRQAGKRPDRPGGSGRNAQQVLANGGVAAVIAIAHKLLGNHIPLEAGGTLQAAYMASLAAVTADTWSTEIGTRWGGAPRLLSTWKRAAPGKSGAISFVGTVAAALGALFLPLCFFKMWGMTAADLVAVAWAGFLASLFDSILGAGLQGQYRDRATSTVSDSAETDGRAGVLISGLCWIDNNVVNFAASAAGAAFCWVLLHYGLRNVL